MRAAIIFKSLVSFEPFKRILKSSDSVDGRPETFKRTGPSRYRVLGYISLYFIGNYYGPYIRCRRVLQGSFSGLVGVLQRSCNPKP